jgi:hypothetical protein
MKTPRWHTDTGNWFVLESYTVPGFLNTLNRTVTVDVVFHGVSPVMSLTETIRLRRKSVVRQAVYRLFPD